MSEEQQPEIIDPEIATTHPIEVTDEMRLSDLTVGQFKQLLHELLAQQVVTQTVATETSDPADDSDAPSSEVNVRRKSLDEFMSDLTGSP